MILYWKVFAGFLTFNPVVKKVPIPVTFRLDVVVIAETLSCVMIPTPPTTLVAIPEAVANPAIVA